MQILKSIVLAAAIISSSSCSKSFTHIVSSGNFSGSELIGKPIVGSHMTTEGSILNFENITDKPLLLMISEEFCIPCNEEAEELRDHLKGEKPRTIHIVTSLAGATQQDAIDWKNIRDIPWTVISDENLKVLKAYCPDFGTPCILIQRPGEGVVKYVGQQKLPISEIEAFTGPIE